MGWVAVAVSLVNCALAYRLGWRSGVASGWRRGVLVGWLQGHDHTAQTVVDYLDEMRDER